MRPAIKPLETPSPSAVAGLQEPLPTSEQTDAPLSRRSEQEPPPTPAQVRLGLERWRLVLGESCESTLGQSMSTDSVARDAALSWLYDRDESLGERDIMSSRGGSGPSTLSVPDWLNQVHTLFPKETIERIERDALERFHLTEIVTNPEVFEKLEPSESLLKAVLQTKHLMNQKVLTLAHVLVEKVVRDLMERLARELRAPFSGTNHKRQRSLLKNSHNFDPKQTLRTNLKHFDRTRGKLLIQSPYFLSRTRRVNDRWQIILLIDESGSMLGSVIHAAVTAACLWGLPSLKTHLCIFDTQVVDLTEQIIDPVEVLMKVQLGGGTDIGRAVRYGGELIDNPRRAIVVLITDLYEGGSPQALISHVKELCAQGTHVLVLAALEEEANPSYDHELGEQLVEVGAHVAAMTPAHLASWIAEKVGG